MTASLTNTMEIMQADENQEQKARPLLTIAVPTFNRSQLLSQFLSAISPQLASEGRVELLISDNASPDETHDVVLKYQMNGAQIRYIRNKANLGADLNILQCFELAAGKYVWICGDDDVIEPGGLAVVLRHLAESDYDLVCLQARGFRGSYVPRPVHGPEKYATFEHAEDLASQVHVFFTFISGVVINKDRVDSLPHRPFKELASTNLVQLGWTYTALEHHRRSLLIHTPILATLANNTGGYALFRVFGTNLKEITESSITSGRVRARIFQGALLSFFPWFLLQQPTTAVFIREDPGMILKEEFGEYLFFWIFNYPILKLPNSLGRLWLGFVRVLNRFDKLFGRPMLRLPLLRLPR